ncbi:DUF2214 family protein [Eisenibacter elegans]|jgi:putative membrane protein|uniref:DUF2214 family protein n=1 Tax=Eisenibacter elegans TaxID=997 RepID=UPI0003F9CCC0|nr:DUF2214 family protein [Eisenibacter elegans]
MLLEISIKYVHFLCIFAIVGALVGEHLLLKPTLSRQELRRLSRIDAIYGISALLLLAAGFTLWFGVGKPADFYTKNWIFHLKIGLFVLIGLLSIYPTVFFLQQSKGQDEELVSIPPLLVWCVRLELLALAIIPFCASLMARGIGTFA